MDLEQGKLVAPPFIYLFIYLFIQSIHLSPIHSMTETIQNEMLR